MPTNQLDWWIALPDGRRFNMSGEEIARKIDSGELAPNLLGSYQGGPFVPLIQSPIFRQAHERRQARLIEYQKAESRKFYKVMAIMAGVAFVGIMVIGIAATIINNVTESNRVEREQREAAKIKEEERQVAEKKRKAFEEMPSAKKIEKAKSIVAADQSNESYTEAMGYLKAIPDGDPSKAEAERLRVSYVAEIKAIEKRKAEIKAKSDPNRQLNASEQASLRERLASQYASLMSQENPHLNYIGSKTTRMKGGYAIWATHEFFTRYTFSTGSDGPLTQRFIQDNWRDLERANVVRVGAMGTGPYSSYCWFDTK